MKCDFDDLELFGESLHFFGAPFLGTNSVKRFGNIPKKQNRILNFYDFQFQEILHFFEALMRLKLLFPRPRLKVGVVILSATIF